MTVKDLIKELSKYDEDTPILLLGEDLWEPEQIYLLPKKKNWYDNFDTIVLK